MRYVYVSRYTSIKSSILPKQKQTIFLNFKSNKHLGFLTAIQHILYAKFSSIVDTSQKVSTFVRTHAKKEYSSSLIFVKINHVMLNKCLEGILLVWRFSKK